MAEYIERGNVLADLSMLFIDSRIIQKYEDGWDDAVKAAMTMVEKKPSVDVRPERHGRWIFGEFDVIGRPVWCSECGSRTKYVADPAAWINYPEHKYCGCCGAKMDRKDSD